MAKTPSTSRRADTREARALAAAEGISYADALRRLTTDRAAAPDHRISLADLLKEVPGTVMPGQAATMVARHIRAAELHLSRAANLAADHGAPLASPLGRLGEKEHLPLERARKRTWDLLFDMTGWANRTAVASGVVDVEPTFFDRSPAEKAAEHALYPAESTWCHVPDGTLPLPGDSRTAPETPSRRVRTSLTGRITTARLIDPNASQRGMVKATRDVIGGTPAEPVWNAHRALNQWQCEWMDRAADTPADLAAALDGLDEVAGELRAVAAGVVGELLRRVDEGSLAGAHQTQLRQAAETINPSGDTFPDDPLRDAIQSARGAVVGSAAVVPPGHRLPPSASQMGGKTLGEIRAVLGDERFMQRQRSRVAPENWTRFDELVAIVQHMHATDSTVFRAAD